MNNRIIQIRKALNLTQEDIGKKIGITRGAVSKIEKGERNVTDQVIISICREFNINEHWLRTGEGEMLNSMPENEELAYAMEKILSNDNEFIKRTMLTLAKLDQSEWELIKKIMTKIKSDTE